MLCIVAHPDDECFAFGGALLLAADAGIETHVLCLTDGQAATHRGEAASGAELGRMRRQEFIASCKVLGVTHAELLEYEDAQLEFADFSKTSRRLVRKLRTLRPEVVLTFGADGGLNTHPDHTMVSMLTQAAVHWAASPKRFPEAGGIHLVDRLYTLSTAFFMDDRPAPLPIPWSVALDVRAVAERKQEAFRQHASQAPLMERARPMFAEHGATEYYTLVAATKPQPVTQATSLFAGLES
jgi:LmbE family N-acetylglucosaminyl deacetylase